MVTPDEPWAWLTTVVVLAANLRTAILVSGAQPNVVRAWSVIAVLGIGASTLIAIIEARVGSGYLALTSLLLTLGRLLGNCGCTLRSAYSLYWKR